MADSYNRKTWARSLQQAVLMGVLAGATAGTAQAQALNYTVGTASNVAGTFTDISTAAGSTVIATANTDDANSAAQPIGFTFNYNGTAFTQFVLNTNGLIRLGSAAPSVANMFAEYEMGQATGIDPISSPDPADVNLLMPFNIDLIAGTGTTQYRVATTGTAPNRVCTVQWTNVSDKSGTTSLSQYAAFTFQAKLYETTNVIDFVYGTATASTNTAAPRFPTVGIKGSGPASGQDILVNKTTSGAAWATAVFITGKYGTSTHNFRANVGPDAGRTYRFVPANANDVAVNAVYTLGKIATSGALPQAVQAYIANAGSAAQTSVAVTLTVSGANTFTSTKTVALPAGAKGTVTFDPLPATLAPGTNTVTVSVQSDDNNTNNSVSVAQLVTADRLSHIEPGKPYTGVLRYDSASVGGVLSAKFTVPGQVLLSDAKISFANTKRTTSFRVIVYDATGTSGTPGNAIYTSPAQNRPLTGGEVTVPLPSLQITGPFHIGVQEASTGGSDISTQSESVLRTGTFYYSGSGSAPWGDLAATTFQVRLGIEAGLAPSPNCLAPSNLVITSTTSTTALLTFTNASNASSYQVTYGPVGFQPSTGGTTVTTTASPVTLTGLNPATTYQVYVRSSCTAGGNSFYSTPVSFVTQCAAGQTASTFPYTQNFDTLLPGQPLPCGFSVLDANNDGTTWAVTATNSNSGANSIRYRGLTLNNVAANDWFFTPALNLLATSRYQVAFRYRGEGITNSPSSYTESLEVKSGTAATVAGQTTLLYTNAAITNTSYALANGISVPVVALLPAGASTQYVGFHVNSQGNQGNLYIDDVAITAVAVTATSEALLRAVSVFPNPSATGIFDLEVHGANAKGGLDVQVTNLLGQRVYSGAARDNYTNRLDLSSLAPGIYTLQVRNGDERLTRQVSIVR